jgi:hypothetical protein
MEETNLLRLITGSATAQRPFFDGNYATVQGQISAAALALSGSTKLNFAICPSFAGNQPTGISNYRANAGVNNGNIIPTANTGTSGMGGLSHMQRLGFRDYSDGTSKTVMVSESRANPTSASDPAPCRWYTGDLWHLASNSCGTLTSGTWSGTSFMRLMSGSNTTTGTTGMTSIVYNNGGPTLLWGPSSDHGGKIVGHLFADGHTEFISSDVNDSTYISLNTRSSGDTIGEY